MDRRCITILVFFDFSKAFGTVSHDSLLAKLQHLGLSHDVINWFKLYSTGRSQAVKDSDGNLSKWLSTSAGVPQGLILGPLLFSLFINDIGNKITNSRRPLYADDLQIYRSCAADEIDDYIARINEDIKAIHEWAGNNLLKLNLSHNFWSPTLHQ